MSIVTHHGPSILLLLQFVCVAAVVLGRSVNEPKGDAFSSPGSGLWSGSGSGSGYDVINDHKSRASPTSSNVNSRFVPRSINKPKGQNEGRDENDSDEEERNRSNNKQRFHRDGSSFVSQEPRLEQVSDVMKRLKKAKTDQAFSKQLQSGPETLGLAFKTFEKLSALWISVMHRIWKLWKAKGAKEVMHSIVKDLVNQTEISIGTKVRTLINRNQSISNIGASIPKTQDSATKGISSTEATKSQLKKSAKGLKDQTEKTHLLDKNELPSFGKKLSNKTVKFNVKSTDWKSSANVMHALTARDTSLPLRTKAFHKITEPKLVKQVKHRINKTGIYLQNNATMGIKTDDPVEVQDQRVSSGSGENRIPSANSAKTITENIPSYNKVVITNNSRIKDDGSGLAFVQGKSRNETGSKSLVMGEDNYSGEVESTLESSANDNQSAERQTAVNNFIDTQSGPLESDDPDKSHLNSWRATAVYSTPLVPLNGDAGFVDTRHMFANSDRKSKTAAKTAQDRFEISGLHTSVEVNNVDGTSGSGDASISDANKGTKDASEKGSFGALKSSGIEDFKILQNTSFTGDEGAVDGEDIPGEFLENAESDNNFDEADSETDIDSSFEGSADDVGSGEGGSSETQDLHGVNDLSQSSSATTPQVKTSNKLSQSSSVVTPEVKASKSKNVTSDYSPPLNSRKKSPKYYFQKISPKISNQVAKKQESSHTNNFLKEQTLFHSTKSSSPTTRKLSNYRKGERRPLQKAEISKPADKVDLRRTETDSSDTKERREQNVSASIPQTATNVSVKQRAENSFKNKKQLSRKVNKAYPEVKNSSANEIKHKNSTTPRIEHVPNGSKWNSSDSKLSGSPDSKKTQGDLEKMDGSNKRRKSYTDGNDTEHKPKTTNGKTVNFEPAHKQDSKQKKVDSRNMNISNKKNKETGGKPESPLAQLNGTNHRSISNFGLGKLVSGATKKAKKFTETVNIVSRMEMLQRKAKDTVGKNNAKTPLSNIRKTTEKNSTSKKVSHKASNHLHKTSNALASKMATKSAIPTPDSRSTVAKEVKPHSSGEEVDLLTSPKPLTSLLTTSVDRRTYKFHPLLQVRSRKDREESDRVAKLEDEITKLESEVTVLQTAMATLVKRVQEVQGNEESINNTLSQKYNNLLSVANHSSTVSTTTTLVPVEKTLNPGDQHQHHAVVLPVSSSTEAPPVEHAVIVDSRAGIDPPASVPEREVWVRMPVQENESQRATEKVPLSSLVSSLSSLASTIVSQQAPAPAPAVPIQNVYTVHSAEPDLVVIPSDKRGCIPGCKNGGRCVAGTACKCPTFFYGAQCERFSLRDLISRPRAWARTTPGKVRRIIITKPGRQFTDQMVRRAQNPNFYKNKEVVLNQDVFPPEKDTSVKRQEIEIVPSSKRSEEALPEEKPLILEI